MAEPTTPFSLTDTAVTVHTAVLPGEATVPFIEVNVSSAHHSGALTTRGVRSETASGSAAMMTPSYIPVPQL